MIEADAREILSQLDRLRTELVDLAFELDTRGRLDAADVALTASARLGEIVAEQTLQVLPPGCFNAGPTGRDANVKVKIRFNSTGQVAVTP